MADGPTCVCFVLHDDEMRWPDILQVLGWMQREMTKRFADMAFHTSTFTEQHALVEDEMRRSNANPPHMFKAFYLQVHQS